MVAQETNELNELIVAKAEEALRILAGEFSGQIKPWITRMFRTVDRTWVEKLTFDPWSKRFMEQALRDVIQAGDASVEPSEFEATDAEVTDWFLGSPNSVIATFHVWQESGKYRSRDVKTIDVLRDAFNEDRRLVHNIVQKHLAKALRENA